MNILEIIEKKKNKEILNQKEINFVVKNFTNGKIFDYQMSAFLMTIVLNGMNLDETFHLTKSMMESGEILDLSSIKGVKVDKHSTGGVGDKTSLALCPVLASLDLKVAKMSGRGLGFTGGTIDKLESIPNFSVNLSKDNFLKQVNEINIAIVGQSEKMVKADKLMYALRDVTGTVDSLPLIASSIMSKKLATGSDVILLDVKCGNGAFLKTEKEASTLAKTMIDLGKKFNKNVQAEITSMDQPLGLNIGNKNEVLEALAFLKGNGPKDFEELIFSSASKILLQSKKAQTNNEAIEKVQEAIKSQKAFNKFKQWIEYQNGNFQAITKNDFWKPKYKVEVKAKSKGYFRFLETKEIGIVAMHLGAGRMSKKDKLDFEAGITLNKKNGDKVLDGEVLLTLYSSKEIPNALVKNIENTFQITKQAFNSPIILKSIS